MYRVIKRFNDRYTGERYEVGDLYGGDDPSGEWAKHSKGRIDHLLARGFLREERTPRSSRKADITPEIGSVRARADSAGDESDTSAARSRSAGSKRGTAAAREGSEQS